MKRFTVKNTMTWGLIRDKDYGGYKLPVSFIDSQDVIDEIEKIAKTQNAKSPFYGISKTIYFKLFELSEKQKEDLLDQDRRKVDLSFVVEDVPFTTDRGIKYLRLRVIGLKRSDMDDEPGSQAPSDEF